MKGFVAAIAAVPADRWTHRTAHGKWNAAELSLHVIDAYDYCLRGLNGGPQMRMQLPPWRMWILRELALPVLFATGRFPREAPAPPEVIPDVSQAALLAQAEAGPRLIDTASRTMDALGVARRDSPDRRIAHAYFGPMSPVQTAKLLIGHTRHHIAGLTSRSA